MPLFYMLFIWKLSSMPSDSVVKFGFSFDDFIREALHLVEFAILFWLLIFAFSASGRTSSIMPVIALIIAALYGAVDEIHQSFIPYRTASMIDLLKDWTGVIISYYVLKYYVRRKTSV
jgi:VanZ family protein